MEQLIGLQTTVSEEAAAAVVAGATLTNIEGKEEVVKEEELQQKQRQHQQQRQRQEQLKDNEKYRQHIRHQEEVFDQLSDIFFADPDKEIPSNELDVTYTDMCYDIMFQILLHHQKKNEEVTTTMHHHDHHHSRDDSMNAIVTRKYHILDVGCGTGVLWEYMFDAFKSIVIQNEHNHHHDQLQLHDRHFVTSTATTTTRYELNITGVDLSSKMVSYAKERASHMIKKHVSIMNHSNGSGGSGNSRPLHNDRDFVIVKPKITVIQGDIMDYCSNATATSNNNNTVDGVIINACYGNFYNPRSVLEVLPNHSIICISHPLGNTFVHKLHDKDSITVPHVLPEEQEETTSDANLDDSIANIMDMSVVCEDSEQESNGGNNKPPAADIVKSSTMFDVLSLTTRPYYLLTLSKKRTKKQPQTPSRQEEEKKEQQHHPPTQDGGELGQSILDKTIASAGAATATTKTGKAILTPVHVGFQTLKEWQSNKNEQIKTQILSTLGDL